MSTFFMSNRRSSWIERYRVEMDVSIWFPPSTYFEPGPPPDRRNDRSVVGHHSSTTDWIAARALVRQESLMNNE